jgi:hypothetical protein
VDWRARQVLRLSQKHHKVIFDICEDIRPNDRRAVTVQQMKIAWYYFVSKAIIIQGSSSIFGHCYYFHPLIFQSTTKFSTNFTLNATQQTAIFWACQKHDASCMRLWRAHAEKNLMIDSSLIVYLMSLVIEATAKG